MCTMAMASASTKPSSNADCVLVVFFSLGIFLVDKNEKNNVYFYRHRFNGKTYIWSGLGWCERKKTQVVMLVALIYFDKRTRVHRVPDKFLFFIESVCLAVWSISVPVRSDIVTSNLLFFSPTISSFLFGTHYKNAAINATEVQSTPKVCIHKIQ